MSDTPTPVEPPAETGPAETIGHDASEVFGAKASVTDRIAALEDIAKQTLGFLAWLFPGHPVPTVVQDAETGLLVAGSVAPVIAAAIPAPAPAEAPAPAAG